MESKETEFFLQNSVSLHTSFYTYYRLGSVDISAQPDNQEGAQTPGSS